MKDSTRHNVQHNVQYSRSALCLYDRSSCRRADCIMDSHTTGPGFKTRCVRYTNKLLTDYHHNSIMKLSVRWSVWKVGEDIKMGSCVFQCDVPHQCDTLLQVGTIVIILQMFKSDVKPKQTNKSVCMTLLLGSVTSHPGGVTFHYSALMKRSLSLQTLKALYSGHSHITRSRAHVLSECPLYR